MENSNQIELNFETVNQMKRLNFYWKAVLNDGTVINQFDNNRDDNFKRVKENFDKLEYFSLYHKEVPEVNFIVDLIQGFMYIGQYHSILDRFKCFKHNIRLIYTRNEETDFLLSNGKSVGERINYIVGYQYNDSVGNNHKSIFQISNNGEISVVD